MDRRAIEKRLKTPPGGYSGSGGSYGQAAGGPFGRARAMPLLPGTPKDWEQEAGDVERCSAVAICLGWLQDQFSQARMEVGTWADAKTFKPAKNHRLMELLGPEGRPNDDYDADAFWSAAIVSYKLDGNVFAIKGRGHGGHGRVEALWHEPHWNVTPYHEPGDPRMVSWYYVQRPEGLYRVDPADMLHIRDGIDRYNPLLGCARAKSITRAVVGHNAAETYQASIVDSMGGIGAVWTPEGEPITEDEANAIAASIQRQTTRLNAAKLLALSHGGKIDRAALGPEEMALDSIPDRFEATICAAMGVNPMVVGLSVGASMRSYDNQAEADRQSWNNGMVPMQSRFGRGLQTTLPDFGGRATAVRFDRSMVPALQTNAKDEAERAGSLYDAGLAKKNEARAIVSLPPDPDGDRYKDDAQAEAPEGGGDEEDLDGGEELDGEDPDLDGDDEEDDEEPTAESLGLSDEDFELLTPEDLDELRGKPRAGTSAKAMGRGAARVAATAPGTPAGGSPKGRRRGLATGRRGASRPPVDGDHDGKIHDGKPNEAPAPGGAGKPAARAPRHVRLAAKLAKVRARYRDLERRGIKDERYTRLVDRSVALVKATNKARAEHAAKLVARRKAERDGAAKPKGDNLPAKPGKAPGSPRDHARENAEHEATARQVRNNHAVTLLNLENRLGARHPQVKEARRRLMEASEKVGLIKDGRWVPRGYVVKPGNEPHFEGKAPLGPRVKGHPLNRRAKGGDGPAGPTPKGPEAASATPPATPQEHGPGFIGEVPTKGIEFDPQRFQYKLAVTDHSTGAVGSLAGVKKWDPELAGVVSVWKDPANGKTYVVNGHNRLDLANKLGVEKVAVRYLDAKDAVMARAKGALANIAEGRGTSLDAAKFFRDSGITSKQDLQSRGIPLTEAKTSEGLGLAGLSSPLFRRAIDGTLPAEKGAIIGGAGLADSQQMQIAGLYDKLKGKVASNQLREMVDEAKAAGVRKKDSGPGLFGADDGPDDESLFLSRTSLNAHVKERLAREKKLFGTVSRQRSADQLAKAGNVIDAEASGKVSRDASEALNVFDSLKRTSVFSGATNSHAERLASAKNEAERKKVRDDYYEEVKRRVKDAYNLGG